MAGVTSEPAFDQVLPALLHALGRHETQIDAGERIVGPSTRRDPFPLEGFDFGRVERGGDGEGRIWQTRLPREPKGICVVTA